MIAFFSPYFLFLFLVIAALVYLRRKTASPSLRFSSGRFFNSGPQSWKLRLSNALIIARYAALALIVIGLMRPRSPVADSKINSEGIAIVLSVDCSTSMLAEDFVINGKRQNRLDVVKTVIQDFIRQREHDSIGVVAFAARAYTVCPMTLDYQWLQENLQRVRIGMIEDGTAVGSGIVAALQRLKQSRAKSKIVILLTDGRNNAGDISPITAAEAAKALGIKIYTIGAGSRGPVPFPAVDFFGNRVYQQAQIDLDEETLQNMAEITHARYFRATDSDSLRKIYQEINTLEKSSMEQSGYRQYHEWFNGFVLAALWLLLAETILGHTVALRIP
jgi:Ca-activated chloride channel homolog